jgi:hypothetical protein
MKLSGGKELDQACPRSRLSHPRPRSGTAQFTGGGLCAVGSIHKGDIVAMKGGYIDDRARRDRLPPHSSHLCLGFLGRSRSVDPV